ncbi:2-oxoacid:acceptor oxidoreductase family protein [Mariprofundus ferrinatatus]|uniref:2-oxoacid:acceptor oxidoreductase family protein n=1 Tax=Mariprofundus ferrinatatus TaxID=1921087 RepID=UPI0012FF4A48|nr:2-oxoacid:acceptor oxidoreductase family protein [Mariprofundus ferrinatatus]
MRIRFHGRGGQGIKTASRILGTALFNAGFEVQDAQRYGAERRGAPIFAYVRADKEPIYERGIISRPDLVAVADDSLIGMPAAGILQGIDSHTVLLIYSSIDAETWGKRLNLESTIIVIAAGESEADRSALPYLGTICAAAAAQLTGLISKDGLDRAIRQELEDMASETIKKNLHNAFESYKQVSRYHGIVSGSDDVAFASYKAPAWVDMPFEAARISAPAIHAGATSVLVNTGLWRTMRPMIDPEQCKRCWWICSSFCPDGVINVSELGEPQIDYDHCKGCLVCLAQCPSHAISAIAESTAKSKPEEEKS